MPKTSSFAYFKGQNSTSTLSFSSGLSGGYLTNLMTDIQNVNIESYIELVYSFGRVPSGYPRLTHLYVSLEMFHRDNRLGLDHWYNWCAHRVRFHLMLFWRPIRSSKLLVHGLHHADDLRRPTIHHVLWVWSVGFAGLLLIIVLCLYNRIRLAVAVSKCSWKFIV